MEKKQVEEKRQHEIEIMNLMIKIYCRGRHGGKKELCPDCAELFAYAAERTEKCPFMAEKTFCSACKVHCYKPQMRQRMKEVMKYAGPRMMFHHPVIAVRHALVTLKGKKRNAER